jgi:hypothetical protein
MPYTTSWLRDALFDWGEIVKHGYAPPATVLDPNKPRLSTHFGPRLPAPAGHIDLCRAFASLHPATAGLANVGDMAWWAHVPDVSRRQRVVWLYYVDGIGLLSFRRDWRAMSVEARTLLVELEKTNPGRYVVPEDDRGDDIIGARLGVSGRTVRRDRGSALDDMLAFLTPPRSAESAA